MEFQIKENFGNGCGGYSYFTAEGSESIEELKEMAIKTMLDNYNNQAKFKYLFYNPKSARSTIEVAEYDLTKNCKVRGGIKFKTKWR